MSKENLSPIKQDPLFDSERGPLSTSQLEAVPLGGAVDQHEPPLLSEEEALKLDSQMLIPQDEEVYDPYAPVRDTEEETEEVPPYVDPEFEKDKDKIQSDFDRGYFKMKQRDAYLKYRKTGELDAGMLGYKTEYPSLEDMPTYKEVRKQMVIPDAWRGDPFTEHLYMTVTNEFPKAWKGFETNLEGLEYRSINREINKLKTGLEEGSLTDESLVGAPTGTISAIGYGPGAAPQYRDIPVAERLAELEDQKLRAQGFIIKRLGEIAIHNDKSSVLDHPEIWDEDGMTWNDLKAMAGSQIPQVGLAMLTYGMGTFYQESGGAYVDNLFEIAREQNIAAGKENPDDIPTSQLLELIETGQDEAALAHATGIGSAALEYAGAKTIADAFIPDKAVRSLLKGELKKQLRGAAGDVGKSTIKGGFVESATEATQNILQDGLQDFAVGREVDIDWGQTLESGSQGGVIGLLLPFAGGSTRIVGGASYRIYNDLDGNSQILDSKKAQDLTSPKTKQEADNIRNNIEQLRVAEEQAVEAQDDELVQVFRQKRHAMEQELADKELVNSQTIQNMTDEELAEQDKNSKGMILTMLFNERATEEQKPFLEAEIEEFKQKLADNENMVREWAPLITNAVGLNSRIEEKVAKDEAYLEANITERGPDQEQNVELIRQLNSLDADIISKEGYITELETENAPNDVIEQRYSELFDLKAERSNVLSRAEVEAPIALKETSATRDRINLNRRKQQDLWNNVANRRPSGKAVAASLGLAGQSRLLPEQYQRFKDLKSKVDESYKAIGTKPTHSLDKNQIKHLTQIAQGEYQSIQLPLDGKFTQVAEKALEGAKEGNAVVNALDRRKALMGALSEAYKAASRQEITAENVDNAIKLFDDLADVRDLVSRDTQRLSNSISDDGKSVRGYKGNDAVKALQKLYPIVQKLQEGNPNNAAKLRDASRAILATTRALELGLGEGIVKRPKLTAKKAFAENMLDLVNYDTTDLAVNGVLGYNIPSLTRDGKTPELTTLKKGDSVIVATDGETISDLKADGYEVVSERSKGVEFANFSEIANQVNEDYKDFGRDDLSDIEANYENIFGKKLKINQEQATEVLSSYETADNMLKVAARALKAVNKDGLYDISQQHKAVSSFKNALAKGDTDSLTELEGVPIIQQIRDYENAKAQYDQADAQIDTLESKKNDPELDEKAIEYLDGQIDRQLVQKANAEEDIKKAAKAIEKSLPKASKLVDEFTKEFNAKFNLSYGISQGSDLFAQLPKQEEGVSDTEYLSELEDFRDKLRANQRTQSDTEKKLLRLVEDNIDLLEEQISDTENEQRVNNQGNGNLANAKNANVAQLNLKALFNKDVKEVRKRLGMAEDDVLTNEKVADLVSEMNDAKATLDNPNLSAGQRKVALNKLNGARTKLAIFFLGFTNSIVGGHAGYQRSEQSDASNQDDFTAEGYKALVEALNDVAYISKDDILDTVETLSETFMDDVSKNNAVKLADVKLQKFESQKLKDAAVKDEMDRGKERVVKTREGLENLKNILDAQRKKVEDDIADKAERKKKMFSKVNLISALREARNEGKITNEMYETIRKELVKAVSTTSDLFSKVRHSVNNALSKLELLGRGMQLSDEARKIRNASTIATKRFNNWNEGYDPSVDQLAILINHSDRFTNGKQNIKAGLFNPTAENLAYIVDNGLNPTREKPFSERNIIQTLNSIDIASNYQANERVNDEDADSELESAFERALYPGVDMGRTQPDFFNQALTDKAIVNNVLGKDLTDELVFEVKEMIDALDKVKVYVNVAKTGEGDIQFKDAETLKGLTGTLQGIAERLGIKPITTEEGVEIGKRRKTGKFIHKEDKDVKVDRLLKEADLKALTVAIDKKIDELILNRLDQAGFNYKKFKSFKNSLLRHTGLNGVEFETAIQFLTKPDNTKRAKNEIEIIPVKEVLENDKVLDYVSSVLEEVDSTFEPTTDRAEVQEALIKYLEGNPSEKKALDLLGYMTGKKKQIDELAAYKDPRTHQANFDYNIDVVGGETFIEFGIKKLRRQFKTHDVEFVVDLGKGEIYGYPTEEAARIANADLGGEVKPYESIGYFSVKTQDGKFRIFETFDEAQAFAKESAAELREKKGKGAFVMPTVDEVVIQGLTFKSADLEGVVPIKDTTTYKDGTPRGPLRRFLNTLRNEVELKALASAEKKASTYTADGMVNQNRLAALQDMAKHLDGVDIDTKSLEDLRSIAPFMPEHVQKQIKDLTYTPTAKELAWLTTAGVMDLNGKVNKRAAKRLEEDYADTFVNRDDIKKAVDKIAGLSKQEREALTNRRYIDERNAAKYKLAKLDEYQKYRDAYIKKHGNAPTDMDIKFLEEANEKAKAETFNDVNPDGTINPIILTLFARTADEGNQNLKREEESAERRQELLDKILKDLELKEYPVRTEKAEPLTYQDASPYKKSKIDQGAREMLTATRIDLMQNHNNYTIDDLVALDRRIGRLIRVGYRRQQEKLGELTDRNKQISEDALRIIEGSPENKGRFDKVNANDVEVANQKNLLKKLMRNNSNYGKVGMAANLLSGVGFADFYGLVDRMVPVKGKQREEFQTLIEKDLVDPLKVANLNYYNYVGGLHSKFEAIVKNRGVKKLLRKGSGIKIQTVEGARELTNNEVVLVYNWLKDPSLHDKVAKGGIDYNKAQAIIQYVKNGSKLKAFADDYTNLFKEYREVINEKLDDNGFRGAEGRVFIIRDKEQQENFNSLREGSPNSRAHIPTTQQQALLEEIYGADNIPFVSEYTPFEATGEDKDSANEFGIFDGGKFNGYTVMSGNLKSRQVAGEMKIVGTSPLRVINKYGEGPLRSAAYLDFAKRASAFFNTKNLRAAEIKYGKGWADAMRNSLERILTGRRNKTQMPTFMRAADRWVSRSIGGIMAINTKSALLQMVSTFNFATENPVAYFASYADKEGMKKAGRAIRESGYFKLRGAGNTDVLLDDLFSTDGSKFGKALDYGLEKAYFLTKAADRFAIAFGGAPYLNAKVKEYGGWDNEAAVAQGMKEFIHKANEAQQATTPDRLGKDQASDIGKYLGAFMNANIQFNRILQKKIKEVRGAKSLGDAAKAFAQFGYFAGVQVMLFPALQQVLFMLSDDEEGDEELFSEKKEKHGRYWDSLTDSVLTATGLRGAAIATLWNAIWKDPVWTKEFLSNIPGVDLEITKDDKKKSYLSKGKFWEEVFNGMPAVGTKIREFQYAFGDKNIYHRSEGGKKAGEYLDENIGLDYHDAYMWAYRIQAITGVPAAEALKLFEQAGDIGQSDDLNAWQEFLTAFGFTRYELEKPLGKSGTDNKKKKSNTRTTNLSEVPLGSDEDVDLGGDLSNVPLQDLSNVPLGNLEEVPLQKSKTDYPVELEHGDYGVLTANGEIQIRGDLPPELERETLIHELQHREDLESGRLKFGDDGITWEGKLYERSEDGQKIKFDGKWVENGYENLPWEKVSYDAEDNPSPQIMKELREIYSNEEKAKKKKAFDPLM